MNRKRVDMTPKHLPFLMAVLLPPLFVAPFAISFVSPIPLFHARNKRSFKKKTGDNNNNRHRVDSTSISSALVDLSSSPSSATSEDTSVIGEADRAFRQGVELEKSGLARAAAASFHEAATLYQCFLDHYRPPPSPDDDDDDDNINDDKDKTNLKETDTNDAIDKLIANEFRHVTTLNPDTPNGGCRSVLAYACVRLAHLSHDALGDPKAATRLYREAVVIDPQPSSVSYSGMGECIEASGGDTKEALEAYRTAHRLSPRNAGVSFRLAVALERSGQTKESEPIMESLKRSEARDMCLVDSWGYVRWHMRKVPQHKLNLQRGTRDMLLLGLNAAMDLIVPKASPDGSEEERQPGLVCEFGVGSGRSIRMLQEMLPLDAPIHGFDTFTGLPHAWGDEPAGAYSTGGNVPNVEGEVYFYKGLFKDTIPTFLKTVAHPEQPLAFANVDCDLYGSTLDVLELLHGRVIPGTVFVFDEYMCHPTWRQDEFRAWRECCKRFGWKYEYLAFSLSTKQAVVRVLDA